MPEKLPTLLSDGDSTRDRLRAFLTVACVVAVVLAGSVLPAASGGGLGGTPLGSVVPQHDANLYGDPGGGGVPGPGMGEPGSLPGAESGGGLGALNPGNRTSVGGSLESGENAFRSQNASVHFTVQSTAPSYWRTGAYDTYTGSGWERTGESRPYDGPIGGDGLRDREVQYRVRLNRSATALPSVWRPATVSGEAGVSADSLSVTDRRALAADDPVSAGATYSGVSHLPAQDPELLRTTGREYPDDLERRYTAMPEGTDDLAAFTDELTADADSAYDTAARVESWLESNKNYSLSAPASGEGVASQFVFESEAGYCEHFATAMTAMLRTQGVPARYAVGYSTGQQVAPNTYEVREMNAHAWVEVYFPEVGWVTFDPTPGSQRLQSEQQAFANRTGSDPTDYRPTESGSPGEQFSANGSTDPGFSRPTTGGASESGDAGLPNDGPPTANGSVGDVPTGDDSTATGGGSTATGTTLTTEDVPTTSGSDDSEGESDRPGSDDSTTTEDSTDTDSPDDSSTDEGSNASDAVDTGYDVELNRTPVPGATVTVTVRNAGTPVGGVAVFFDGERVGTTGEDGSVTAQVPYVENLTVTVADAGDDGGEPGDVGAPDDAMVPGTSVMSAAPPPGLDAPMSLSAPSLQSTPSLQSAPTGNGTGGNGTEYELATDAALSVSGNRTVGSEVVVTATVEDVPVREGAVRLDGERVATTDRRGRATVVLPDAPGNATLSVERGPVTGQTVVEIPRLNVSVAPALPLALPGTPAEVTATYGGDPVSDAQVTVAGASATTDFDGSATATLPFANSADAVVSARGQTRRATLSGLLVNLAAVLGGVALVVGGLGYGASRRGYGPRRLAGLVAAGVRAVPGLAVAVLFGLADWLERVAERALAALRDLRVGESTVRELLARFRAWFGERLTRARGWLAGLPARVRAWLRERLGSEATSAGETATDSPATPASADAHEREEDAYRTLRQAWADFLAVVSVRDPESATPGELAAHAIRVDDLPSGAVLTLRDAFRDVEYGARSSADRLPRVERAVEVIERAGETDAPSESDADLAGTDSTARDAPDEATLPGGDD